jgi:hypothetical protein
MTDKYDATYYRDYQIKRLGWANATIPKHPTSDCPNCNGRGYVWVLRGDNMLTRKCDCYRHAQEQTRQPLGFNAQYGTVERERYEQGSLLPDYADSP